MAELSDDQIWKQAEKEGEELFSGVDFAPPKPEEENPDGPDAGAEGAPATTPASGAGVGADNQPEPPEDKIADINPIDHAEEDDDKAGTAPNGGDAGAGTEGGEHEEENQPAVVAEVDDSAKGAVKTLPPGWRLVNDTHGNRMLVPPKETFLLELGRSSLAPPRNKV